MIHNDSDSKPDLIIGIDFGQTCTGVAYSLTQGSDQIRQIQRWPGVSHRNENKVPTLLVYPKDSDRSLLWGFKAENQGHREGAIVREWFKTFLDPAHLERWQQKNPNDPISHPDVKRWYRDFLNLLHGHIKQTLSAELPNFGFDGAKIEYLFSVPTTWSPQVVSLFRALICEAGFGYGSQHKVVMSLTEAEAAAVFTSTAAAGIFEQGDLLVVCDAGGGTSDLSALEVTDTTVDSLSLKQLRQLLVVAGENIGSVAIDVDFEALILKRLKAANTRAALNVDLEVAAWEMQKSPHFQNVKCEHGALDQAPQFFLPISGIKPGYVDREAGIADGHMRFNNSDLQGVFDDQVTKLFRLMDKQLKALAETEPGKQIRHLVLSGGLGQSAYVQQRLRSNYYRSDRLNNIQNIQIRVAPEPQMAVCKGLVADRLRKLRVGQSVLGWRCCRASYGLLCKELYDKDKHVGRQVEKDPTDNQLYVPHCIDWLIKKGVPVTTDRPIRHFFRRRIKPGDPRKLFPSTIVSSYMDQYKLPNKLETGVDELCTILSDLSLADERKFVAKNRKFWQSGESHLIIEYEVRVLIGPADLVFELWFENQKLSDERAIKVEWVSSEKPASAESSLEQFEDDSLRVSDAAQRKGRRRLLRSMR